MSYFFSFSFCLCSPLPTPVQVEIHVHFVDCSNWNIMKRREKTKQNTQPKKAPTTVFSSLLVFFPVVKENSHFRAWEKKR